MTLAELKKKLTSTTWSPETLEVAIRAGFKCEYCGRSFFDSVNDYYSFERDHIVPRGVGEDTIDNLAACCETCNFLKRRWDPRIVAGDDASRGELVAATKQYVSDKRIDLERRIEGERDLAMQILTMLT